MWYLLQYVKSLQIFRMKSPNIVLHLEDWSGSEKQELNLFF